MTLAARPGRIRPLTLGGIILAQLLWLGWVLVVPLPSVVGARIQRGNLLLAADDHLRAAFAQLAHVENLPQRIPILLASLLVGAASLAVGSALLTSLGDRLDRAIPERVALGFGLGTVVLGGATLLLGRWVGLDPTIVRWALGAAIVVGGAVDWGIRWREPTGAEGDRLPGWSLGQVVGLAALVGPFLLLMGLGALLPTIEFDALEYHLQGPKEYFLDGRIAFLPHNVYTSMPAGVEMLTTLTMEVADDWWLGGLAGQELIAWFAPAAAVLIGATASQIAGSSRAGWFAALIYLTTPWVFRGATTPFVEGPLCFLHAALVWAVVRSGWFTRGPADPLTRPLGSGLLVGLLAGGALAIKYPGLVSAVVPAGLVVLSAAIRHRSIRLAIGFLLGVGGVVAPWLGKNWGDTGNPVYPLAWSIFGGTDWDAARNAQWQAAHGPRSITAGLLARSVLDVAGRSDWQSPLYAAFVPLAWLADRPRRLTTGLAIYAAFLFLTWWLLTHRLDRFWLPMLPPLAVLAGLGASSLLATSRAAAAWGLLLFIVGIAANGTLCTTELCGPTAWTGDLASVRTATAHDGTPSLARLDEALPTGARPLVIGQAGTYGLRHRPIYNTVFDRDRFEAIAAGQSPATIAASLHRARITHVYVDWAEIERYRQPGNYGFTAFETPELFAGLVATGVLGPATRLGASQVLYPVR